MPQQEAFINAIPIPLNTGKSQIQMALEQNAQQAHTCQYMGLREKLDSWKQLGADNVLLQAIQTGARAPMNSIPCPNMYQKTLSSKDSDSLQATIGEYLQTGVVRPLTPQEEMKTKYWVPTFPRPKKDSNKIRIITDLRGLNMCHSTPKFKSENWSQILSTLQEENMDWGMTMDLKGYFHHLMVHPQTQRWMRIRVGTQTFQLVAMPFGWSASPYWANKLSKPLRKWLNQMGIPHLWYVDDIMILGPTKDITQKRMLLLIHKMTTLGIQINMNKTMKEASQQVTYLGHCFNLKEKLISPLMEKQKVSLAMTKKQLRSQVITPKYLAALAGNLLDANKSNPGLQGLPQQLMKCAAKAVEINRKRLCSNTYKAWHYSVSKQEASPSQMRLQDLLRMCLYHLQHPVKKVYRHTKDQELILQTDASDKAWGGSC